MKYLTQGCHNIYKDVIFKTSNVDTMKNDITCLEYKNLNVFE